MYDHIYVYRWKTPFALSILQTQFIIENYTSGFNTLFHDAKKMKFLAMKLNFLSLINFFFFCFCCPNSVFPLFRRVEIDLSAKMHRSLIHQHQKMKKR